MATKRQSQLARVQAELREWQQRYHELALRLAENARSSTVAPVEVAPIVDDIAWRPSPSILEAIESRTVPFSPERTANLTYAREALAANTPEEVIIKTILDGEAVVI